MFASGPKYDKLKTNLRLSINRLRLLQKKKTEQALKARKEIADYISGHKEDRARIRVEHIVREDYIVEAYELIEMYCDLLLARFGLIQQMKEIDEGIEEAINSVLWAAPRIVADVPEMKVITDQIALKYGKPYVEACRANQFHKVNPKLVTKLSVAAPPKVLVEKYMVAIAKSHDVPFVPDQGVMSQDEVACAEQQLIDFRNTGQMYPNPDPNYPPYSGAGANLPQPPANNFAAPSNNSGDGKGGSGNGNGGGGGYSLPVLPAPLGWAQAPQMPDKVPQNPSPGTASAPPPPAYENVGSNLRDPLGQPPSATNLSELNLPDPPSGFDGDNQTEGQGSASGNKDDIDFDDLTKRFENLKKKK